MIFQSVLKVYWITENGQNMAKIEKIGNIQIVDNKEDKFFYFPMISMACTGSGYEKRKINPCKSKVCKDLSFFYWDIAETFSFWVSKNIAVSHYYLWLNVVNKLPLKRNKAY